jgi:phosphoribosylanthranilate isomerase
MRTRIKICGITRPEHARTAAEAGADAIGLVFYPPSPRFVEFDQAVRVAAAAGPFVARVAVFVNPARALVETVLDQVPIELLQFHGEEDAGFCASFGRPWLKAARVAPGLDLVNYLGAYPGAAGWLLDSWRRDEYGGTGEAFDWDVIPRDTQRPLILSGGLTDQTVGEAVRRVRPWAIDVSSGVERSKGEKDPALIRRFVEAVRRADAAGQGPADDSEQGQPADE